MEQVEIKGPGSDLYDREKKNNYNYLKINNFWPMQINVPLKAFNLQELSVCVFLSTTKIHYSLIFFLLDNCETLSCPVSCWNIYNI